MLINKLNSSQESTVIVKDKTLAYLDGSNGNSEEDEKVMKRVTFSR